MRDWQRSVTRVGNVWGIQGPFYLTGGLGDGGTISGMWDGEKNRKREVVRKPFRLKVEFGVRGVGVGWRWRPKRGRFENVAVRRLVGMRSAGMALIGYAEMEGLP